MPSAGGCSRLNGKAGGAGRAASAGRSARAGARPGERGEPPAATARQLPNSQVVPFASVAVALTQRPAAETLRVSLRGNEDRFRAYDLYFLAMSHHRLGEPGLARVYFDWAEQAVRAAKDLNPEHRGQLAAFHAEAAALLGLPPSPEPEGSPSGKKPKD